MNEQRYLDAAARMQLIHLGNSAGVVYWQPAGLRLYENLRSYIRKVHAAHGYLEVKSPALVNVQEFARSGHLAKYREGMFLANQANQPCPAPGAPAAESAQEQELSGYALRPMSCPNHIELYASARRSYRELPLALFEFGEVFRNEPSGSLQVLFRQRQFCQDDSHVFVREQQVQEGVRAYLSLALQVYRELGFQDVEVAISSRPSLRFGDDALWDRAEEALRQACRDSDIAWAEQPGSGAFYGPKIELGVRDKLGRLWQMGVVQLDYVLPERFDLEYVNEAGEFERPVMLHHAVLGSLERMIGVMLEVFGVDLPEQLHPYPLVLVPVSADKHLAFAQAQAAALRAKGELCDVDSANEPVSAKVRRWKARGARRIQVVGDVEMAAGLLP